MQHSLLTAKFLLMLAVCAFQVNGSSSSVKSIKFVTKTLSHRDNWDISETLARVLVGVSYRPPTDAAIEYEYTDLFFMELMNIAPKFTVALDAVCFIVNRDKELTAEGDVVNFDSLLQEALYTFYGDDENEHDMYTFLMLFPSIEKVMNGNLEAAKRIVATLASKFKDFRKLKNIDPQQLLEKALDDVDD